MKIGTPLGEYPFEFRRIERRPEGLVIVGTVAGLESTVVLSPKELAKLAGVFSLPLIVGYALGRARRRA